MNWMFSCNQVGELISRRLDEPLSLLDTMRLRLHLWMCSNCSNVERQIGEVHSLSTELFSEGLSCDDTGPQPSQQTGDRHRPSKREE